MHVARDITTRKETGEALGESEPKRENKSDCTLSKGETMDQRINRFKLCDLRFYPYLKRIIERLPQEVREDVLNDKSFQILTDDDALNACVLRYRFSDPVETLVYLNTKILNEPEHQLIHTIASEFAHYVLNKRKFGLGSKDIDDLLMQWGFEKEVEAVRLYKILCDSKGYKIGYEWAKKQNRDYLMQHFGLYYDEWNDEGLVGFSGEGPEMVDHLNGTRSILENIIHSKSVDPAEPRKDTFSETRSLRKEMLAGILTAVKEAI